MYIRTCLHTYITSTLVVHQHLLPRRTRRNHKAQKLTREAGGKIVSPTFRLPRCYGGETTKEPHPRIENDPHRLDHKGIGVKVAAIYVTITHTVSTTRALASRLHLHICSGTCCCLKCRFINRRCSSPYEGWYLL